MAQVIKSYPVINISAEMLDEAKLKVGQVKVERTVASKIDTVTGILGEFIFAEYFYGDWKKNRVGKNKGDIDFPDIEIKTSAFPFSEKLNLLVREDYALKRKPAMYVQIIIDVDSQKAEVIKPGSKAYICGWASYTEVDKAPKKDMGSKLSGSGGYKCHYINIKELHDIHVTYIKY